MIACMEHPISSAPQVLEICSHAYVSVSLLRYMAGALPFSTLSDCWTGGCRMDSNNIHLGGIN